MRLTEPQDVVEGMISKQPDKRIVNRGKHYNNRIDCTRRDCQHDATTHGGSAIKAQSVYEIVFVIHCVRMRHLSVCLVLSQPDHTGTYVPEAWQVKVDGCLPLFMRLYYVKIPQNIIRFYTFRLVRQEQLNGSTDSLIKVSNAESLNRSKSKPQMLQISIKMLQYMSMILPCDQIKHDFFFINMYFLYSNWLHSFQANGFWFGESKGQAYLKPIYSQTCSADPPWHLSGCIRSRLCRNTTWKIFILFSILGGQKKVYMEWKQILILI